MIGAAAGRAAFAPSEAPPGAPLRDRLSGPRDRAAAERAARALGLLAVDPSLGALVLGRHGPGRSDWLEALESLLRPLGPVRRLPVGAQSDRVLGGLDLAATLAAGRPIVASGLLAEAHGGVVVIPQADLLDPGLSAQLASALDTGRRRLEREGVSAEAPARFGVVALSEPDDSQPPPWSGLTDRIGLLVSVPAGWRRPPLDGISKDAERARAALPTVACDEESVGALCEIAARMGIRSLRPPIFALRAARAAAALAGRRRVGEADLALATTLVLAPRAQPTTEPGGDAGPERESDDASESYDRSPPPSPEPAARAESRDGNSQPRAAEPPDVLRDRRGDDTEGTLAERVLAAVRVSLPPRLLEGRRDPGASRSPRGGDGGRSGVRRRTARHGRQLGTRIGEAREAGDLDVLATIRAAAPWQRVRGADVAAGDRLAVRPEDFRLKVRERRSGTLTIFAVDASGSQTLHRLAETKGAVELLLAEGYARRDQAALVTFRRRGAEVSLPPTRALARARRVLSSLPGGGATPLAAGIEAAHRLAVGARRDGLSAVLILLTDGKANVALDGTADRERARADALAAARRIAGNGFTSIVIDTSRRGSEFAARLADAMGAERVRLPVPRARDLGRLARGVTRAAGAR